jgi:hypothetical protein
MSTTQDTSAIDEKKAEETGTSTASPDFKGFATNYLLSIIFTIGIVIFIIGGLGLYTTKVAQSNILPDNIEYAPYTIFDREVSPIPIDINVMRPSIFSENGDTLSQKVIFNSKEYLDSFNKSFLCSLKKSAVPTNGMFANLPLYFSFVYDNIVANNFLAINTLFFYLSFLPESVIMFLYGFFGIFLWIGLYFFNICISIFYHIINIPQLFRSASYNNNETQWEPMKEIGFIRFVKLVLFFFLWIPIGSLSAFIVPPFFTIYGLIAPLLTTYKLTQKATNKNKTYNVIDFIKNTFAYKQFFFFVLATISLFSNGSKYLGNNAIFGIIIAVMFAYFMGLYSNEMPIPNNNGFSLTIQQNIKQASVAEITRTNPKLVKICSQIPIDDEKIKNIIKNNNPRELTKQTNIGGDGEVNVPISEPIKTPDPISEPIKTPDPISEPILRPLIPDPISEPILRPLIPDPISEPVSRPLIPDPISEPVSRPKLSPSSVINPTKVNTSAPIINATPTSSTRRLIK